MRGVWNGFRVGVSMYSKIPMSKVDWTEDSMRYAMCFFPLVGGMIGALVVLWYWVETYLGVGDILASVVYVAIPIVITGGIHMDGLLDTIDALSSYQSKERKLEILKDPNVGAFAVIYCGVYLLLSFGVWSEVSGETIGMLACVFVLSRALSGFGVVSLKMAKDSGTVNSFSGAANKKRVKVIMILYIVMISGVLLWLDVVVGGLCLAVALLVFMYYRRMSYRQFGGITGDLAGYFLQLCELIMAAVIVLGNML